MNYFDYEKKIKSFKRLIQNDDSSSFKIFLKKASDKKESITFNLTTNKARIFSKKINEMYQVDPTIDYYEIIIEDNEEFSVYEDAFSQILKSIEEKVTIEKEKRKQVNLLLFLLGEDEEIPIEISSINESVSLLNTKNHSESIEYISNHFLEFIENNFISNIDQNILIDIFEYYFINNIKKNSKENEKIFDLIHEKNVQLTMMFLLQIEYNNFNDKMKEYFYNNLDDDFVEDFFPQILFQIKQHFLYEKNKKQIIANCEYENDELSGIISYLKKATNDDILNVNNDVLLITSGGVQDPGYPITNMIKYDEDNIDEYYYNYIENPKKNDGWIKFDFKDKKINLTSYTLRSSGGYSAHPISWRILGSNDNESWDVLDNQENCPDLNGVRQQHRFTCKKNDKYYRYIKYDQEKCSYTKDGDESKFSITCIEFFGSISA